jgi:hypothetical protein
MEKSKLHINRLFKVKKVVNDIIFDIMVHG